MTSESFAYSEIMAEARQSGVVVCHNNENGEWLWAVSVRDYWLDAFPSITDAKRFCKQHGLTISRITDYAKP